MRKYGKVWCIKSGVTKPINDGYTEEELRELVEAWRTNAASIGADIYDLTGDLAIGPQILEDLLNHMEECLNKVRVLTKQIKELEGKSVP